MLQEIAAVSEELATMVTRRERVSCGWLYN